MDYKVYYPKDIKIYGGGVYESRLLLDSYMAGEPCVNINHGTVNPGCTTGAKKEDGSLYGPAHEKAEIYLGLSGSATCYLNDNPHHMECGTLIYIPGGCEHYLVNDSATEKFELVTIWPDEKDNETWVNRLKDWGTTYKTVDMD